MTLDLLFYVAFALLIAHELDAIQRHEWRIIPLICKLKDETAYYLFITLHVPLLVLLLWFMFHPSENVRYWFQVGMDLFFVVHLGLHKLFESHHQYEFTGTFSKSIIFLMALVGLVHLGFLVF